MREVLNYISPVEDDLITDDNVKDAILVRSKEFFFSTVHLINGGFFFEKKIECNC
jgi:hypothetical protein